MEFTKEEIQELKLMLLERAKAKAISILQEQARIERTALVDQTIASRNLIMTASKPIDDKLKSDIALIESATTIEEIK